MAKRERHGLDVWAASLPASFYVNHPNSDRATLRLVGALAEADTVAEETIPRYRGRRVAVGDGCPLTVRELQALGGYAAGLSLAEIAEVLGVKAHSVSTFVSHAYDMLLLPDRRPGSRQSATRAVAIAIRNGWL